MDSFINIINAEKARYQRLLTLFNTRGSSMEVRDKDGVFVKTLVDSFTILKVEPFFDLNGNINKSNFWLLWKSLGYDEGFQYSHTTKIVDVLVDDSLMIADEKGKFKAWLIVELTDDRERIHHIELILPIQQPEYVTDWKNWQSYKQMNAEKFKAIDEQILQEHLRIAEDWE